MRFSGVIVVWRDGGFPSSSRSILGPLGVGATAFAYTPHPRPRAAVGYHPRLSLMRPLLPRWVIGEPAGRWNAALRDATVPR